MDFFSVDWNLDVLLKFTSCSYTVVKKIHCHLFLERTHYYYCHSSKDVA